MHPSRLVGLLPLAALWFAVPALAQDDDEDPAMEIDFGDMMIDGSLGAPSPMRMKAHMGVTAGGAQDISWFRDRVSAGEIPHAATFTPEGLFSEHDLPLSDPPPCARLFCAAGEAVEARLIVQEDVRYLAQLGFTTSMTPETFKRPPLNVVAVVDKSGSMSGVIDIVRRSLHEVVNHLEPGDQLSIVTYGSNSEVLMAPTRDHEVMSAGIDAIAIEGSTYLEAGLKLGFEVAQRSRRGFDGTTRVMLFTDERPNVGRTDAESFMGMAEAASREGIGMTTIGVGTQFGAELATKVSSVRGGNLFFFADAPSMQETFASDFDTMVVELAYELELEVAPAPGLRIAGVYGIPGEALEWTDDGAIRLEIATLFLSKRAGGLFVALASDTSDALPPTRLRPGRDVATVTMDYQARDGRHEPSTVGLSLVRSGAAGLGLSRGHLLVDEVTALKQATALHNDGNDQEGAYQVVHSLASRFRTLDDADLAKERTLVLELEDLLAFRSGHQGEGGTDEALGVDPVSGLPLE